MITIDDKSGFCFGVVTAIRKAEIELAGKTQLYCLGDIVHNNLEVERLERLGLTTINHEQFKNLNNAKVLLRAHGEPPQTYKTAQSNNIEVIDATCPVVLNLQKKIRSTYTDNQKAQIVIFGKQGHAEVVGLQGQTDNTAIVVERLADIDKIDFSKDIHLFSQTTKSVEEFHLLISEIEKRIAGLPISFHWHDTICRQVSNRVNHIREFAAQHEVIIFVGGRKSSNGKVLFEHCSEVNPHSVFIESPDEITDEMISAMNGKDIGVCGATSTPYWLMETVRQRLSEH